MTLLEKIREAFARLAELSADELDALKADIIKCSDEYDELPATAENLTVLQELAEIGDAVMAQAEQLVAAQAKAEEDKKAAQARIAKLKGEPVDEIPTEGEPEGEPAAEGAPEGEPVAVAASGARPAGTTIRRIAASRAGKPPEGSPEIDPKPTHSHLVASGNVHGVAQGTIFEDRYALAEAMAATLDRKRRNDKPTGDTLIASAEWDYPENRRLTTAPGTAMNLHDAKLIDAVCHPTALLATGGICAPVNVDWSLGTWAVADRPLRDGLPAFQATRGGLIHRVPPDIADLASATGVWTEATDLNPDDDTKPVLAIACPSPLTDYVDAVSTRLGFGNMESMFDPETVAANTDLAVAAAARVAELNLLGKIQTACAGYVTSAQLLGGTRDFLATLDQVRAAYRDLHRLSDTQTVTVILPRWIKDLMRADRVRELAHDGQSVDPLAIPDAYIEGLFSARGVNPIFVLESVDADTAGANPLQNFGVFTTTQPVPVFPTSVVWIMFVEGSIQFLDAGRLDLGVVRDSTLDATNDYETFVETFEGIADRGFTASALQIVTALCPNGATAATADSSSLCA